MNTATATKSSPRTRRPRTVPTVKPTTAATTADAIAALIEAECRALAPDLDVQALDADDAQLALASVSIRNLADINSIGSGLRDAIRRLQAIIAAALDLTGEGGAAVGGCACANVRCAAALIVRCSETLARVYAHDLAIVCEAE